MLKGGLTLITAFLVVTSTSAYAVYPVRPWGNIPAPYSPQFQKERGYNGRYNPWSTPEEVEGSESNIEPEKSEKIFGSAKPEIEWPSEEKMGRTPKSNDETERLRYRYPVAPIPMGPPGAGSMWGGGVYPRYGYPPYR